VLANTSAHVSEPQVVCTCYYYYNNLVTGYLLWARCRFA